MVNTMITQKKQPLKRVSYIGLSFFSLVILFDAQAKNHTSSYTKEERETQRETRNRIAVKWGLHPRSTSSYQCPTLGGEAIKFKDAAKQTAAAIKESNEQETRVIKESVKSVIKSKVKDEETKSAFFQFLDGFFNE
jgi:hypothetical protein